MVRQNNKTQVPSERIRFVGLTSTSFVASTELSDWVSKQQDTFRKDSSNQQDIRQNNKTVEKTKRISVGEDVTESLNRKE
ncbi:MAG: hypothetical protein ABIH47_00140 [Candidatus Omnitrophota bacterium]